MANQVPFNLLTKVPNATNDSTGLAIPEHKALVHAHTGRTYRFSNGYFMFELIGQEIDLTCFDCYIICADNVHKNPVWPMYLHCIYWLVSRKG